MGSKLYYSLKVVLDVLFLGAVFFLVGVYRFSGLSHIPTIIELFGLLFLISFLGLSFLRRDYMSKIPRDALDSFFSTIKNFLVSYLLAIVSTVFIVIGHPSRLTLGLFLLVGLPVMSCYRYFYNRYFSPKIIDKEFKVIIAGAGKVGEEVASKLQKLFGRQVKVIGFLDDHEEYFSYPILGRLADLERVVGEFNPSGLFIAISNIEEDKILSLMEKARGLGLPVKIISDVFDVVAQKVTGGSMEKWPVIDIQDTPVRQTQWLFKRAFDIAGSSLLLLFFSPLLFMSAVLIKLESKGPVFYKTRRMKNREQTFGMLKFRTMYIDQCGDEGGLEDEKKRRGIGVKGDPRITKVGRWLRRFSIDELPQLFNVFKGEMSLVGPRPPVPAEVKDYHPWHKKRLDGCPGMTGLWQVSGRTNLDFEDMVLLDIYYLENWSLGLDLKILLKTVPAVLGGRGVN